MSARDDYPLLAFYDRDEHSAGGECAKALDEIDLHRANYAESAEAMMFVAEMNDRLADENQHLKDRVFRAYQAASAHYEDQTFEQARMLLLAMITNGRDSIADAFWTLRNTGLLRNDEEVRAFDAWEQST